MPKDAAWNFVAVGCGHEDLELDQLGGLRQAAENLIADEAEAGV